jgi:hypothetical protein
VSQPDATVKIEERLASQEGVCSTELVQIGEVAFFVSLLRASFSFNLEICSFIFFYRVLVICVLLCTGPRFVTHRQRLAKILAILKR